MLGSRTEGALKDESATWCRRIRRAALLALCAHSLGCSAITATVECRRAQRATDAASESAPDGSFQLTLARAYLEKAREEASEAHYGAAVRLAEASEAAARRARDTTSRGKGRHE